MKLNVATLLAFVGAISCGVYCPKVHAAECESFFKAGSAKITLPDRRSPQLKRATQRQKAISATIKRLGDKLRGESVGDLFGFPLMKTEESLAKTQVHVIKDDLVRLKRRKIRLRENIDQAKEENRRTLIRDYETQMRDPQTNGFLSDYKQMLNMDRLPTRELVSVLVGSPDRLPTEKEIETYTELVSELVSRNYTVIYDADSTAAKFIAEAAGIHGIGISMSSQQPSFNYGGVILHFNNPYSFLEVIHHGWATIVSPDSLLGQAALINNDTDFVLDLRSHGDVKNTLYDWAQSLNGEESKFNLGLSYKKLKISRSVDSILKATYVRENSKHERAVFAQITEPKIQLRSFDIPVEQLSYEEIAHMMEYRDIMSIGQEALGSIGGASIFGTSRLHETVAPLAYALGQYFARHGIPVSTGGAGGIMYAANMGAFDGGGVSVGIPMVGRGRLGYEQSTPTHLQTHTIPAFDYHARIPLLLLNREIIAIEPGGSGTMRELATALVSLRYANPKPYIFVLDTEYYKPMLKFIDSLDMSPEMRSHIIFASDVVDTAIVIKQLVAENKLDLSERLQNVAPPRSDRTEFPKEELQKSEEGE